MTTFPLANPEPPEQHDKPSAQEGESCPNCGSRTPWGPASWCPDCGYYPALGGKALRTAEEVNRGGEAWETHTGSESLLEAFPPWAGRVLAGSFLIVFLNATARLMLPLEEAHLALITLVELSLGMIMTFLAHWAAYLFAACKNDKFGPFDFVMRPMEIWKPTFAKLPDGSRRVCLMAWGMTFLFCALVIIRGFNFDALFDDWGFEQPEPPSAVQAKLEDESHNVFLETQCVILGYTRTDTGDLNSVILASAPQGRLAYVGLLSQADVPEESRKDLLQELKQTPKLESCFINRGVPIDQAIWIEPKVLCKIEHVSWTTQYTLQQPKFLKLIDPEEEKQAEEEKKEKAKEKAKAAKDGKKSK